MEYLVMKVKPSYAVLLDGSGRFHYAANLNYQVGQTVTDPFLMDVQDESIPASRAQDFEAQAADPVIDLESARPDRPKVQSQAQQKKSRNNRLVVGLIALVAVFGLFFAGNTVYDNFFQIYSSIILKINPEVEMDLNKQGDVIGLKGRNEDGIALVEEYEKELAQGTFTETRDRTEMMADLITLAKDMGYLVDGGQISISINSNDKDQEAAIQTEMETMIKQFDDGSTQINISLPE